MGHSPAWTSRCAGLVPLMSLTLIEPRQRSGSLRQAGELALHEQFITTREDYVRAFENGDREAARRVVDYFGGQGKLPCAPVPGCGRYSFG